MRGEQESIDVARKISHNSWILPYAHYPLKNDLRWHAWTTLSLCWHTTKLARDLRQRPTPYSYKVHSECQVGVSLSSAKSAHQYHPDVLQVSQSHPAPEQTQAFVAGARGQDSKLGCMILWQRCTAVATMHGSEQPPLPVLGMLFGRESLACKQLICSSYTSSMLQAAFNSTWTGPCEVQHALVLRDHSSYMTRDTLMMCFGCSLLLLGVTSLNGQGTCQQLTSAGTPCQSGVCRGTVAAGGAM